MKIRNWKQGVSVVTALGLSAGSLIGLSGCGKEEAKQEDMEVLAEGSDVEQESSGEKAMGRYLEEDVALPEGTSLVEGLTFLEDGTLRLLARGEDYDFFITDSQDKGASWGEPVKLREMIGLGEAFSMGAVAQAKDGSIFLVATEYGMDENGQSTGEMVSKYFYVTSDGTVKELALQEAMGEAYAYRAIFSDQGTVLLNATGGIKEIDVNTGTVVQTYEEEHSVSAMGTVENYLVTVLSDGIHYYDLETKKPLEDYTALTEQITADSDNLTLMNVQSQPVFFTAGDEKDSLFYVEHNGIYRYALGGNVVEQICDGALNSIGSPDTQFTGFVRDEEGSFYLAALDYTEDMGKGRLIKYTYSADTPTVPETELTVYSLKEDTMLRQVAAVFQKKYPDIYLNLESGMDENGTMTVTDALKTLNTEIMADKGPDVLLMDGIPQDTYIEKGMLEDISKITEEAGLLENIRQSYTQEDGAVYTMPVKFGIPMVQGKKEDVERVENLVTLADVLADSPEAYTAEYQPLPVSMTPGMLISALAQVSASAWLQEDGTLNEELVKEFLEQVNCIYQLDSEEIQAFIDEIAAQEGIDTADVYSQMDEEVISINGQALPLLGNFRRMSVGEMNSPSALADMYSLEVVDDTYSSKLLNGQDQNVFLPSKLVGISSKSKEKEAAEKFVQFLFSEEGQNLSKSYGLPVSQSAYDSEEYWDIGSKDGIAGYTTSTNNETGAEISMEIRQPSAEAIEKIKTTGKSLTTPACDNSIILEAVSQAGERYMFGEISLEEAVKEAVAKVQLYLQE